MCSDFPSGMLEGRFAIGKLYVQLLMVMFLLMFIWGHSGNIAISQSIDATEEAADSVISIVVKASGILQSMASVVDGIIGTVEQLTTEINSTVPTKPELLVWLFEKICFGWDKFRAFASRATRRVLLIQ